MKSVTVGSEKTDWAYRVVRFYFNKPGRGRVIMNHVTIEQAQAHCRDPETSSRTCTLPMNTRRTRRLGPWFDGYEVSHGR